jgi:ligand-binding sensor domain-containing protein
MQIDLYPDDGVAHDITTGVSHANDILWVGTYFGLSRYDGRRWNSYYEHDSGLPSDFINFLKAQDDVVYLSTDNGFGLFDGQRWAAYTNENGRGKVTLTNGEKVEELFLESAISNNYVWGLDVQGDEVWLATADGVSYSKAAKQTDLHSSTLEKAASDKGNSK